MTKAYSKNLVIASHNLGKIHEFKSLLSPYNIKIKSSSDLAISDVDEVGKTFEENAIIKVKSVPKKLATVAPSFGNTFRKLRPARPRIFHKLLSPRLNFLEVSYL